MDQQKWHEFRRLGIGGSDAPVIMNGVHFGKTPYMLWEEKYLGKHEEKDNYAMKRGRDLEDEGREEFKRLTGISVSKRDCVVHPEIPWLRCNLDGVDFSGEVILEIKHPSLEDHLCALAGSVPTKYMPQMEHIWLANPEAKEVNYLSRHDKHPPALIRTEKTFYEELFKKEREFWDHVLKGKPPELNEFDYINMADNPEWLAHEHELVEIRLMKKALEEKDDELVSKLKVLSQGRSAKGLKIVMQKQMCMGAVDYSKVPELEGVDLSPYRKKPFPKWPIRLI